MSYETDYVDDYVSDKKRLLALLLAFLFGVFGVHRFYVGKYPSAIAMVLLDLTLIGFVVTGVWSLVDCLFIAFGEFTDGDGRKLLVWT
jgi:TM2 domain-containing membrane protein YozV